MELAVAGLDVGATKMRAGVVVRGRLLRVVERPTPSTEGPGAVCDAVAEVVAGIASDGLDGLGIGIAGQVERGVVRSSPNLAGWRDVALARKLERRLKVPTFVMNDARAAALGESVAGHGRNVQDLLYLAFGTGIGAGIVSRGRIVEGATGCAGELGHVPVEIRGWRCTCGRRGCLEAYAGGWAIAREARRLVRMHPRRGRRLVEVAEGRNRITARHVTEAWKQGDVLARQILDEAANATEVAVRGFLNAFNPGMLVLGGGLVDGFPDLVHHVRKAASQALPPARKVLVRQSALGQDATIWGAAAGIERRLAMASNVKGGDLSWVP